MSKAITGGLAGILGMLGIEDSEAGLLHAGARGARDFTGRKPGDYKAPNLSKAGRSMPVVAQWSDELTKLKSVGADSHALENKLLDYLKGDGSNSNLHNWPGFAKRIDGGVNGPFYLNGMDVFYEELVELMPQHEDIIRGVISRRQGGGKGRDFNKYESKHSAQNAQARNIGGGGVLDEAAYQQKVRRAETDPNLRVPRYTDPIVRRNENTFIDPKTGRKKARQVSFAVGDPGMGDQYAQAQYDNYETGKQGKMQELGLLADPMYEYGNLLPMKQNIVTGENSLAVPNIVRDMLGGIFGIGEGLKQGMVNPNDVTDVFL